MFPQISESTEEGIIAVGGKLSVENLLYAYHNGIFPWFNNPPVLWWVTNPRFVLYPQNLIISKSMRQVLKKDIFKFTHNQCFEEVVINCANVKRKGQDGTWISKNIVKSYLELHNLGIAHSFEAWMNDELVGGFYGLKINKVFCGESMFSKVDNASKSVFINFVANANNMDIELIDCQVHSKHLESLGATFITLGEYLKILQK